jgi:predicted nuclease of predicted toxin-antitoxin system
MNFVADESVDHGIVERLRREGHRVWYVAEMAPAISDEVVLDTANREGALLLTADKDFGELVFRQRRFSGGVILVRLAGLSAVRKAEVAVTAINQCESRLAGSFTVIAPGVSRTRRLTP